MLLLIVTVGIITYVLPYYCIKLVYIERRKRGISPRCSSYNLKDMSYDE